MLWYKCQLGSRIRSMLYDVNKWLILLVFRCTFDSTSLVNVFEKVYFVAMFLWLIGYFCNDYAFFDDRDWDWLRCVKIESFIVKWVGENAYMKTFYLYSARNFTWKSRKRSSISFNFSGCGRIVVLKWYVPGRWPNPAPGTMQMPVLSSNWKA